MENEEKTNQGRIKIMQRSILRGKELNENQMRGSNNWVEIR